MRRRDKLPPLCGEKFLHLRFIERRRFTHLNVNGVLRTMAETGTEPVAIDIAH